MFGEVAVVCPATTQACCGKCADSSEEGCAAGGLFLPETAVLVDGGGASGWLLLGKGFSGVLFGLCHGLSMWCVPMCRICQTYASPVKHGSLLSSEEHSQFGAASAKAPELNFVKQNSPGALPRLSCDVLIAYYPVSRLAAAIGVVVSVLVCVR